ncbi:hypothetical protein LJR219_005114 [Phenylobacterium sp. LjRoot219]|uniref:hypothetical protein n=1 Tax=Phenylobacterium sp. LjRoot219 TaxID=3342283 RepID=UPI003ECE7541
MTAQDLRHEAELMERAAAAITPSTDRNELLAYAKELRRRAAALTREAESGASLSDDRD